MGLITPNLVTSNSSSGATKDVHIYVDEYGNVEQILNSTYKERLKFYTDTKPTEPVTTEYCVIGVSDEANGSCTEGIAMGVGDADGGVMAYAIYT